MDHPLSHEPLGRHGAMVRKEGALRLADLDTGGLRQLFLARGLVLYRGFGVTPADAAALAARFTARYFIGYGRQVFPDHPMITTVNEAPQPLAPHCDNGMRPDDQRPEITWLYCEAPAREGGETTIYDGVRIWEALSAESRRALLAQPIAFHTRYPAPVWRQMGYQDPDAFGRFIGGLGGTPRALPDGTVEVVVLSPPVRRTRFSGQLTFVSSMGLAGTPGFESLRVTWADGSAIPAALHEEVRAALAAEEALIAWQAGDLAMLDNTRFLHGRRGYTDLGRRLYLIQTLRVNF